MKVSGTQGPQVTLSYHAEQRLTSILRRTASGGASVTTNFSYDNADRMTTITQSSSAAGALATYLYSYDAASQLTQYTGPEGTLTYSYDTASELTKVGDARTENYGYDLNGNRNTTGYTTGSDNTLSADGTFTYAYDAEGSQISKTRTSDGEQWSMTWNYRNRMTQDVEKTAAGVTVTNDVFTYDVEGRRIGKSTNGTQGWFGYDCQNEYADFNSGGSLTERYLTGKALDSLYARFDGTNTGWYLDDILGSVRQIVNTSGTVLDALAYDSYGQIISETNSANCDRFKYTSREWDSEISQYFYRGRPGYNPLDGRFTSEDPTGFRGGDANLFRYVHNAPCSAIDPQGTDEFGIPDHAFRANAMAWYMTGLRSLVPTPDQQAKADEAAFMRARVACYGLCLNTIKSPASYTYPEEDPLVHAFSSFEFAFAYHQRAQGSILFAVEWRENGGMRNPCAGVMPGRDALLLPGEIYTNFRPYTPCLLNYATLIADYPDKSMWYWQTTQPEPDWWGHYHETFYQFKENDTENGVEFHGLYHYYGSQFFDHVTYCVRCTRFAPMHTNTGAF